jgi:hypothetical protein
MKLRLILFPTALACALASIGTSRGGEAGGKVVEEVRLDPEWTAGIVGKGIKTNSAFTEGNLFFMYPWTNTIGEGGTMAGSMAFVESYNTWGTGGELGASLGVGFRHLFSDQSVRDAVSGTQAGLLTEGFYVGANAFTDFARSSNGGDFWQLGGGLEAGTRYIEVRGNYYVPVSDENVINRRTTSSSTTSTSSSVTSRAVVTRKTTTTTRSVFETYEEAMEGWDMEVALLVPGLDKYMDLFLIGGYYGFTGDRSATPDIDGWRAGVELRPVPNVVLGATWFESDQLYQDNWLASISVEMPWSTEASVGTMAASAFKPRRRHLAERLFKLVHRKNMAITGSGQTSEEVSSTTESTTTTSSQNRPTPQAPPPPDEGMGMPL